MRGKAHQREEEARKSPASCAKALLSLSRVDWARPGAVATSGARVISAPAHESTLAKRAKDDYLSAMLLAFPLGGAELLIILAIALVIFGPSKLPQLGSGLGKMLSGFKKEIRALEDDNEDESGAPAGEIDVTPAKSED